MTKSQIQKSLDTYFESIQEVLKNISKGNKDLLFQIVYKIYHPLEDRDNVSSLDVFTIFCQSIDFLKHNLGEHFKTETIKINGKRWSLVTNTLTGKQMPISIDNFYDTSPSMIAGKIIFFILMETL